MKNLVLAVREMRPAPCDRFGGCEHRRTCAREEMACEQFHNYVMGSNGGTRGRAPQQIPSADIFNKVLKRGRYYDPADWREDFTDDG